MSSSDSCPLLTLRFQGQLQRQRMSSCPACAAWHPCQSLSQSADPAQLQPCALPGKTCPHPDTDARPAGTHAGRTQAALFSSIFAFSLTPGMCLHMVEKMQRAGRSGQERRLACRPPCWRLAAGHSGSRQHGYPGNLEQPLMPIAGEPRGDEGNFGGNLFWN